ncbi:PIN domain-containing protein [Mycolicibacter icosiumassiliensis]|uniref:PIN domain-containing protein n=1 Tax=Mycolicibacter icosiumassiliensis TaxID=1792835 RepID=UPI000A510758|nr:PIN domain-containing protein [Mycolicibacter icosiumassiliensis]
MTAFVDTNILVRHLTGDPPDLAARATEYLRSAERLLLADVIVAETVYVLKSFYRAPREQVAEAIRSLITFDCMNSVDPALLSASSPSTPWSISPPGSACTPGSPSPPTPRLDPPQPGSSRLSRSARLQSR